MSAARHLLGVYGALMILLAVTAGLAYLPLGHLHMVMALGIAVAKAALVALYFMELRTARHLVWLAAGAGGFWLGILFILSLSDYLTRGWFPWTSPLGP